MHETIECTEELSNVVRLIHSSNRIIAIVGMNLLKVLRIKGLEYLLVAESLLFEGMDCIKNMENIYLIMFKYVQIWKQLPNMSICWEN